MNGKWIGFVTVVSVSLLSGASAEEVNFPDPNLEAAVRDALGIPAPTPITDTDMAGLGSFDAGSSDIANIQGLEYGVNLAELQLGGNQISDISPIAGLTNLYDVVLSANEISDISAIAGLTNLAIVRLSRNEISDISVVAGLTNLVGLTLISNQISDVSAVAGLTNLDWLQLEGNQIETLDLSSAELPSLTYFSIASDWGTAPSNPLTTVLLVDATLSQTSFSALMDGGSAPSCDFGIAGLPGVLILDMSGVDFAGISSLSAMYYDDGMDDLEKLSLAGATNLDGGQVVTLTGELDSMNWLDVTGLWDSFDVAEQGSLNAWDAVPGNTLIIPEPACAVLLVLGALAVRRRRHPA